MSDYEILSTVLSINILIIMIITLVISIYKRKYKPSDDLYLTV